MEKEQLEKRKKVIYDLIRDPLYVPMKVKEMAVLLSVAKEQRGELEEVLNALLAEGKIEVSKRGRFSKAKGRIYTGTFTRHARGYGFVAIEGEEEEIFIPAGQVNGAIHMDTVQVAIAPSLTGKRREGTIVKVLSHGLRQVIGTYQASQNFGFVVPDDTRLGQDIFIPKERSKGAVTGHKTVVEITDYGSSQKKPEGKVVEILGHINDPGTDILSLIRAYDLPMEFPVKVLNQAERVAREVSSADMAGRMDIRDWRMVTIDGEDAKDLDDAVSLTEEDGMYCLGVHIADVTNYVQERSALDVEALERGTSVYLVDRVIPMLPHTLSNGICSLNQGEDRLALSCIMTIDPKGKVVDHKIKETVIRVDRRMSYTDVKKILEDGDAALMDEYRDFVPMFQQMQKLAGILREKRRKRGSVDFDFPETKITLDEKGHPVEIRPYERNAATKIIEDFMLIANETVAEDFFWQEIPFLFRSHTEPDEEKLEKMEQFLRGFGYHLRKKDGEIHPREIQKVLQTAEGTDEERIITRMVLRSMMQARYTAENTGHFGLAAKYYCHFTSPIRRYPDLEIHRLIKKTLHGEMDEKNAAAYNAKMPDIAKHCSQRERIADEAERDTDALKKVEYMEDKIGNVYEGIVSGVTGWGLYVELPNTIEGMVPLAQMDDDYYEFDEKNMLVFGRRTKKIYRLGDRVLVTVAKVDRIMGTIDFIFEEDFAPFDEQA